VDTGPRVLVVGGSGLVGGALLKEFGADAVGTCWRTARDGLVPLDITDARQVDDLLAALRPRIILHAAAQSNVDRCELQPEESYIVNVEGARHVASAAARIGARLVYFSSDYVFDGTAGPYPPDAQPAPLNVYGRHKLEAERIVAALKDHLIARACGVYGYHPGGKNFIMGLIARGKRREPMKVPSDQWGTPTFVGSLAAAVRELALSSYVGVVHPVGPDYLSRIDFARRAADVLGLSADFLEPATTSELRQPARRPLRGGVDNRSTQARLRTRLVGVAEGLAAVRRRLDQDRARP